MMETMEFHRFRTYKHIHVCYFGAAAVSHQRISTAVAVQEQPTQKPRWESQRDNADRPCKENRLNEASSATGQRGSGFPVDFRTYNDLLKACTDMKELKKTHAQILLSGLQQDIVLQTKLVSMYATCGSLWDARLVFDKTPERNVFLWNAIIRGYARNGLSEETLGLYYRMKEEGIQPDNSTFPFVLKACAGLTALPEGKEIHDHIIRSEFEWDTYVGNGLVNMYAKCGNIEHARQVFDKMSQRDVGSWTAMIVGYTYNGRGDEALTLFHQMHLADVKPNSVTMVSVIPACANVGALQQGKAIHGYVIRSGFEFDVSVGTAIVDMYAKSGDIEDARQVFDNISQRNVVSWTAMIAGYAQNGHANEALALFRQMQLVDVAPDSITMVSVLAACACLGALQQGKWIHAYINRSGFESNVSVVNSLVAMYARCGNIEVARQLFDKVVKRDAVSWNAMIAGYAQNGQTGEALTLFHEMQLADVKPDSVTMGMFKMDVPMRLWHFSIKCNCQV